MVNYDGLYNKEFYGDQLNQNHFSDKKLSFRIIENGTILPNKSFSINGKPVHLGGLLDGQLNFIDGTHVNKGIGGRYTPNEEIPFHLEPVIFLGTFNTDVWGHCFTDDLQRIWFLRDAFYKKYFKEVPLVYLSLNAGGGVIPNLLKLFKILEIDIQRLHLINKPVKFKTVIIPDSSFFKSEITMFSSEYIETIDIIKSFALKNYLPLSNKNFYIFYGRNSFGEERIANYFYSKGFAIVKPEKLSLEEQLNLF